MKTKSIKTYYILLISVLAVLTAFLSVLFFGNTNGYSAQAAGNAGAPPDGQYDVTLTMDVNGADASIDLEDSADKVRGANDKAYRTRQITLGSLLNIYATNASNGVTSANVNKYNTTNFSVSTTLDNGVYNSFNSFVKVEKVSTGARVSSLKFSALRYQADIKPFIAVEFARTAAADADLPESIFVYINFTIQSSFTPASSNDYIQNAHADDKSLYLKGDADNTGTRVELKNNSTYMFYLNSLIGAELQYKNNDGAFVSIREPIDQSNSWVLNDVSYFDVATGSIGNIVGSENVKVGLSGNGNQPVLLIDAHFSELQVNSFSQFDPVTDTYLDFWNAKHYLKFTLKEQMGSRSVTISKRVYFTSSGAPVHKSTYDMPTLLNATSPYQATSSGKYVFKDDKTSEEMTETIDIKSAGYSQVRIKPSYLCDFPSKGKQYFDPTARVGDSTGSITIYPKNYVSLEIVYKKSEAGEDLSEVDYYLLTATSNGSAEVTFPILYTTNASVDAQVEPYYVTVVFEVYGKYSLSPLSLKGKKAVNFSTVTDNYFKPLLEEDFHFVEASFADDSSKEKLQWSLNNNNNNLTLTPLSSGEATLTLEFLNLSGQHIFINWTVSINYEGGSFLATWETIYVVLFFIGIGIVVIGLILFLVWLFIRGVSKRKEEENATTAPTSAYIIKLNSTIAAAQAQQRLATTQAFNAAQTQMLALGAGPTSTGVPAPNTLQLGAAPASMPGNGGTMSMPPEINNININFSQPSPTEEIYIPLSDDELLERIFIEKYEPRGMTRRSFFKSKDLQSRELEKEKNRIRGDVRGGMTIEEACKSLGERQATQGDAAASDAEAAPAEESQETVIINILGFDPDAPLIAEPLAEVAEGETQEETTLKTVENRMERIEKELSVLEDRLNKTQLEIDKAQKALESTESAVQMKEDSNVALKKTIEDLEFKLATAKSKDKDKLLKDIDNKEHVIAANKDIIVKLQEELTLKRTNLETLNSILGRYDETKKSTCENLASVKSEYEEAKENYRVSQELLEKAKKAQETKGKLEKLRPMLEKVNTLDVEIRRLINQVEKDAKEKDTFKADVSDLQKQMLNTNDVGRVNELSSRMADLNKQVSALDRTIAANNKSKADKTIVFNGERRKANEYIDRVEIEVEDVVREEDDVISKMAFEEYIAKTHQERKDAEESMTALQSKYDELVGSYDTNVMDIAVKTAAALKEAQDALDQTQAELDALNANMETASDDDKLMMSIDQMSLTERLEQQQQQLNELQAVSTKEKIEYQMRYDNELEETKRELEDAQHAYEEASRKVDESMNTMNPLDLILSGSGVISQDRQRLEAENLKKQLELSKSAMEQAKLQAKMAQMDAEKAIVDAQRASDASKQEAERLAQEAIAKAEEARSAAEQKAAEETEKARQEIEKAKQEAEEQAEKARQEIEKAKQEAEQQAEQARKEAEEARVAAEQKAAEETEKVKKAAEEEAERVKREVEEEAERVRKAAEEEAERAKKAAEEETERIKREAEETKRLAEEEAERKRLEKQAEEDRIKQKISAKKTKILEIRKELKDVSNEASAGILREKFYTELVNLDDDEKTSSELKDLINKSMDDATHAGEISMYKDLAHKEPKRIVKKVTERINRIPKKPSGSGRTGARPAGARPGASGRTGARPTGARPGAPGRTGARPVGARPGAARPGARPTTGAKPRPTTSRPSGTRPTRPGGQKPKQ